MMTCAVAGIVISLAAVAASAQEKKCAGCSAAHRHGPPTLMLLSRKAIREDLKLTDDQSQRIRAALVKQITAFVDTIDLPKEQRAQKFPELRAQGELAAAEILTSDQQARLKQIRLQLQGARAFLNPETAGKLGLSDEQREKLSATLKEARKEFGALFKEGMKREDAGPKLAELRRRITEQALSVLTEEQRARWKEMTGAPVSRDLRVFWHRGSRRCPACAKN
jgi:Spy/CpxP family protein refolding chaperone